MKAIFKQSSLLFLAQSFARGVGFLYTIFLARNLTVSDFGLYGTALAFYSLTSTIAEFGFNRFLVREVARDLKNASSYLLTIGVLRLTIGAVLFGVSSLFFYNLDPDQTRVNLILLATLAVLPTSLAQVLDSIFVGIRKLQFSSGAVVITSIFTFILGFILVRQGFGVTGVVVGLLIGQIIYFLSLLLFLIHQKLLKKTSFKQNLVKEIIVGSLPYGILGILGLLYFRIDTLLLSYLKGNYETGIYTAAYKFLETSMLIPAALSIAIFPVMTKLHDLGDKNIKKIYYKSLLVLGLVAGLVTAGFILILPIIIKLLLPDYNESIDVVRILSLAIPFIYLASPGVQIMLSTDRYLRQVIFFSIFTLSFNLFLNLIFIPKFSFIGAAWVTVASEVLSFIIFFSFIKLKVLKNF